MRYFTLEKIKAEDNLATLFNAYLKGLMMLDSIVTPRETVREYRTLLAQYGSSNPEGPTTEARQLFEFRLPYFYHLQVLSNALTDIHKNVGWAIDALTVFFDAYAGDLTRYAIEKRLEILQEDGSDDDADYNDDDTIKYRDDAEALARFTLARDLEQYFAGADDRARKSAPATRLTTPRSPTWCSARPTSTPSRCWSNSRGRSCPCTTRMRKAR